ncbi:MAG: prepilin-type N-terminal cleavage/methylation domain-containing protein [Sulfurovum sp.]|nr:prepilin-type N-terminal cleavage/methylation domain-containing protein [Sulfurovum sp.]
MKKGFTLIELLIVIAIISLFGFLIFDFLKQAQIKKDPYTIKNLKKTIEGSGNVELLCINKCTQCFVHAIGSDDMQEVASNLKEIHAYLLDKDDNPQKIDFGRWEDNRICLRFRRYANGSSTQIILASEDKYFYFPSYFGEVGIHESLEDAADAWISDTKVLRSKGNYY